MNERELYQQILGIVAPWRVSGVELRLADGEVIVTVESTSSAERCPECGKRSPRYDGEVRRWRHLDTCQYRTLLVAEVPRVRCAAHGVRRVAVPWAEARSRFTALFEAAVIDWLLHTENLAAVAKGLRLSWDQVAGIRARAVERGLKRRGKVPLPAAIGVDETSFKKRHEYVTVVSAIAAPRVLDVLDDRTEASLTGFLDRYTPEERSRIEAVALDMWRPYINALREMLNDADLKMCFDRFHIMKHLGDAVDKVRRREHRELRAAGDDRLIGTKFLWLTHPRELRGEKRERLDALRHGVLRTARAFRYKEHASKLWGYVRRDTAEARWQQWFNGASRCALEPVRKVARMIKHHWMGVINAATSDITNAMAESINSHIQRIKKRACGFRSRPRFREAILFHLGGLDLYPASVARTHTNA